jgi:hypothetical protein
VQDIFMGLLPRDFEEVLEVGQSVYNPDPGGFRESLPTFRNSSIHHGIGADPRDVEATTDSDMWNLHFSLRINDCADPMRRWVEPM